MDERPSVNRETTEQRRLTFDMGTKAEKQMDLRENVISPSRNL